MDKHQGELYGKIQKNDTIGLDIRTGIIKGIIKAFRDFGVITDKKCLYRGPMGSIDFIANMDSTSRPVFRQSKRGMWQNID